jgi:prolyl oligopeptidase
MRFSVFILSMILVTMHAAGQSPQSNHAHQTKKFPPTMQQPITDTYHGTSVTEDYRWLEDFQDAAVRRWSAAQNAYARSVLDALPGVDAIRGQVTEILSAATVSYGSVSYRGDKFFAIKRQPPKQQPFIIAMDSLDDVDTARVIVDPNVIDPEGTTHVDWYKVSPDGKLLAVSMSSGGSETGNLSIYDVATAKMVHEQIPNVNSGTAGGSLAWLADSTGFFYTKHFKVAPQDPEDQNVFQHVYLHKLGTAISSDKYELGEGFPQIAEIQLVMDDDSGRLLATVQEGDGGEFAHHLRSVEGKWRQFSSFGDGTKQAVFGRQDYLFVVTLTGASRGRIVRVPIGTLDVASSPTVIAEGKDTIVTSGIAFWGETTVLPTKDRLYVVYQLGGPSELRAFDYSGNPVAAPKQFDVSAIHGLMPLDDDTILFGNTSYTQPDAYHRFDASTGQTVKTKLATLSPTTMNDARVIRRFAKSKDGTRVPLNVILPAGVEPDGKNPCVIYGYGGYGVNIVPRFRPLNRILMDRKVIYVVANIRGGSEFGESWHLEGNLTNKQNVFDDFAACVSFMTEAGYTSPERTAILGGSNGGLLMGATLTQHPDKIKAVVALVGIYDMLRVELSPNGAFNVPEFGTVNDEDQFKALHAYSPYHNVKDGVKYPAVLFMTGENDPRVDPMQSRKMTARLQAATASGQPVLLRTSANAGHGSGNSLSEEIEQSVDMFAFLFDQLKVEQP